MKVECPNCGERNKVREIAIINTDGTITKLPTITTCSYCEITFDWKRNYNE